MTDTAEVERFEPWEVHDVRKELWVRASDYDALAAKLAEADERIAWLDCGFEQAMADTRAAEQMLNEADLTYNRKTNDLIARHAEQVTALKARAEAAEAKLAEVTDDCDDLQIALASARKQLERYIGEAEAALPAVYRLGLADAEFACTNVIKNYDVTYDGGKKFAPMKTQNAAKGMVSIAREDIRELPTPTAAELMARIQTGEKE